MSASLANDWLARVSPLRAADLTNPDPPTASTASSLAPTAVNMAQLGQAVADATANFTDRTGQAYNGLLNNHVAAGVLGVTFYLQSYRELPGTKSLDAAEKAWTRACARLALLLPTGSSQLQPSIDCGVPDFDRSRFGDITPQAPGPSNNSPGGLIGNPPGLFS